MQFHCSPASRSELGTHLPGPWLLIAVSWKPQSHSSGREACPLIINAQMLLAQRLEDRAVADGQ
jgi:hypothetical protein